MTISLPARHDHGPSMGMVRPLHRHILGGQSLVGFVHVDQDLFPAPHLTPQRMPPNRFVSRLLEAHQRPQRKVHPRIDVHRRRREVVARFGGVRLCEPLGLWLIELIPGSHAHGDEVKGHEDEAECGVELKVAVRWVADLEGAVEQRECDEGSALSVVVHGHVEVGLGSLVVQGDACHIVRLHILFPAAVGATSPWPLPLPLPLLLDERQP